MTDLDESRSSSGLAHFLKRLDDVWLMTNGGVEYMNTILSIDWVGDCDRRTDIIRRVQRTMCEGVATRIAARDAEEHRTHRPPGSS